MEKAIRLLEKNHLRKTTVRVQVLNLFLQTDEALSSNLIEQKFEKIDRITLYRTLKTFEQKGLIHRAIDGSDKIKYAVCHDDCNSDHHVDNHAHFRCDDCGKTFCLEDVETPEITIPKGFKVDSTHLVIEGQCENCAE